MATVEPQVLPSPQPESAQAQAAPAAPEILGTRIEDGVSLGPYETTYRTARGYCQDRTVIRP